MRERTNRYAQARYLSAGYSDLLRWIKMEIKIMKQRLEGKK